jgi:large subunit ribosomal protein L28
MPRVCQVTGRKPQVGNSYARRGIAKKKKGIGLKITGKTKRRFNPNLQKKRFWNPEEKRFITLRVTPSGIKTIDRNGLCAVMRGIKAGCAKA